MKDCWICLIVTTGIALAIALTVAGLGWLIGCDLNVPAHLLAGIFIGARHFGDHS